MYCLQISEILDSVKRLIIAVMEIMRLVPRGAGEEQDVVSFDQERNILEARHGGVHGFRVDDVADTFPLNEVGRTEQRQQIPVGRRFVKRPAAKRVIVPAFRVPL